MNKLFKLWLGIGILLISYCAVSSDPTRPTEPVVNKTQELTYEQEKARDRALFNKHSEVRQELTIKELERSRSY